MYEQHFGLKKRPFCANATGTDTFVGPHMAATLAGIKKSLAGSDAIVVVSGAVGSGKSTIVSRSMESIGESCQSVYIGRMRLDSNDVLEFLLDELGVDERPKGTIQKFVMFRRQLKELEANGTRLIVTIEDGVRLGADTLAEIEALTASDAGESEGASLIVMGDTSLDEMLGDPQLARVNQRVRQRLTTAALPKAELRGYLRHCFRLAGADFESIFDTNTANLLHHLSDGIPRIANNIVESAMRAASDQGLSKVSSELVARIAENEFGLSAADFDFSAKDPAKITATSDIPLEQPPETTAAPVTREESSSIPELPVPESVPIAEPEPIPEPAPVAEALTLAVRSTAKQVQDWERDPTMAELKPDMDALEKALASDEENELKVESETESAPELQPAVTPEPKVVAEEPEKIPEITLDHAISQRIENNLIDEPGEVSAPTAKGGNAESPAVEIPKRQNKKADAELENISVVLAKAKSIEDVDDLLAETLFGEELNFLASQALANPPGGNSANEDFDDEAVGEQVANGTIPDVEVTLEAPKPIANGMDLSASLRLKTVRALNADLRPSIQEPKTSAVDTSVDPAPIYEPDPIEDQITSMTQTLKALDVTPPLADDDEEEKKGGFFSRFKRS